MFDISYNGGNSVTITTKKSTLVVDPKVSVHGLKDVVVKGAVELATEERFLTGNDEYVLSLSYPGSYEVSDFSINGFAEKRHIDTEKDGKKAVIYSVDIQGVKIGVIGNVGPEISDNQLENLGVLDVLILPVGGNGYTLDATSAAKIARSSDAKIIIPVSYEEDGVAYEVPQASVTTFVKEMGLESETVSKFKLKSVNAIPEKPSIVIVEKTK